MEQKRVGNKKIDPSKYMLLDGQDPTFTNGVNALSLVIQCVHRQTQNPLKSFTAAFPEPLPIIKATCEKYEQKRFFQKNKMSIDNGGTMGLLLQILKGGTENQKKHAPKALQCDVSLRLALATQAICNA